MQDKKQVQILRYLFIIAFLVVICAVFCARLVSLQIVDRPEGLDDDVPTYERKETIIATRGEIYDRNGVPLIKNDYSRAIILDYGDMPWTVAETNELILACMEQITAADGEQSVNPVDYFPFDSITGDVNYADSFTSGGENAHRLSWLLSKYELGEETTAPELLSYLLSRWELKDKEGDFIYSEAETYTLLSV